MERISEREFELEVIFILSTITYTIIVQVVKKYVGENCY